VCARVHLSVRLFAMAEWRLGKYFGTSPRKKGRAYTAIAAAAAAGGGNRVFICIMVTLSSIKINLTHSHTHSACRPIWAAHNAPLMQDKKTQIEMLPRALWSIFIHLANQLHTHFETRIKSNLVSIFNLNSLQSNASIKKLRCKSELHLYPSGHEKESSCNVFGAFFFRANSTTEQDQNLLQRAETKIAADTFLRSSHTKYLSALLVLAYVLGPRGISRVLFIVCGQPEREKKKAAKLARARKKRQRITSKLLKVQISIFRAGRRAA
jgi:hypothetical protein